MQLPLEDGDGDDDGSNGAHGFPADWLAPISTQSGITRVCNQQRSRRFWKETEENRVLIGSLWNQPASSGTFWEEPSGNRLKLRSIVGMADEKKRNCFIIVT